MGKRWKTVKNIGASMEHIGNDGKNIETQDFLQDIFFQSLKRKAGKDRKTMGFCLWKTSSIYHPGNICWHLFGVALTDLHI